VILEFTERNTEKQSKERNKRILMNETTIKIMCEGVNDLIN
jgi:hypothetical protein